MLDKDRDIADDLEDDIIDDSTDDSDERHAVGEDGTPMLTFQAPTLATAHASTPLELARLGLSEIAYIRPAIVNDVPMWSIHSAAGDPLGAAESFELAWSAVKQNDLEPVRVH